MQPSHETRKLCEGNHLPAEAYVVSPESVNGASAGLCMTAKAGRGGID
jgi:hypothetical protein